MVFSGGGGAAMARRRRRPVAAAAAASGGGGGTAAAARGSRVARVHLQGRAAQRAREVCVLEVEEVVARDGVVAERGSERAEARVREPRADGSDVPRADWRHL